MTHAGLSDHRHLLGTMLDKDLAAIADVKPNTVTQKRIRAGVLRFSPSLENEVETAFCAMLTEPYQRQVTTPLGRIDILTDTTIYECKHKLGLGELHKALGQLICYQFVFPSREMAIVCTEIAIPQDAIDMLTVCFEIEIIVVEPPAMGRPRKVEQPQ